MLMRTLVIEVRGGVVQEVYSDAQDVRVILVDWDTDDGDGERCSGGNFATQPIGSLPEDTLRAVLSLTA
ncbi:MAG TPA: hypothetical protein VK993_08045 [Chthoniobacterales bacterium]|nr:hypothetical protein [Chthoniobacterales bacterium]